MSHISQKELKIENFQPRFVPEAVELMAKHHNFSVIKGVNQVTAMDGRKANAEIVIRHMKDRYDIGINYTSGNLELIGEFYSNKSAYTKLEEWMNAYYSAVVYGHSMIESGEYQEFNYEWNEKQQELVVEGVAY